MCLVRMSTGSVWRIALLHVAAQGTDDVSSPRMSTVVPLCHRRVEADGTRHVWYAVFVLSRVQSYPMTCALRNVSPVFCQEVTAAGGKK